MRFIFRRDDVFIRADDVLKILKSSEYNLIQFSDEIETIEDAKSHARGF